MRCGRVCGAGRVGGRGVQASGESTRIVLIADFGEGRLCRGNLAVCDIARRHWLGTERTIDEPPSASWFVLSSAAVHSAHASLSLAKVFPASLLALHSRLPHLPANRRTPTGEGTQPTTLNQHSNATHRFITALISFIQATTPPTRAGRIACQVGFLARTTS